MRAAMVQHGARRLGGWRLRGSTVAFMQFASTTTPMTLGGCDGTTAVGPFDTSLEAAYPMLLSQRVAACLAVVAKQRGYTLGAPQRLHDLSTAVQGKQSKKHPALISEFHHFETTCCFKSCFLRDPKLLPPHYGGDDVREEQETLSVGKKVKLGFYHSLNSFCRKPCKQGTPWIQQSTWKELSRSH